MDYSNVVVKKPWGYEYLAWDNGYCAVWILHIARGRKTSTHCHPNKKTKLIVLSGRATVYEIDEIDRFRSTSYALLDLDDTNIDKGIYHCTEAVGTATSEDGIWLMEIEYPSDKEDLVREDDVYGRKSQPYETGENLVEYSHEWLKLKHGKQSYMGLEFAVGEKQDHIKCFDLGEGQYLSIRKEPSTMKVSDYVANFIAKQGIKEVFSVCGGGSMHLVDSIGKHEKLTYIATHHEQAAAMAAEAYSRMNGLGCALLTTGPGGTNALTGVACAWVDSIPVIYISGQVTRNTLLKDTGLRQFGIQESDIVSLVKPVTKYSVTVIDENMIRYHLEKSVHIAKSGRPGPVWLDIPLDIQSKQIDVNKLRGYEPIEKLKTWTKDQLTSCLSLLKDSTRPVMIVGNGVHLSSAEKEVCELAYRLGIPIVSSWTASDIFDHKHENYIGRCGIFGDRASNFAVQNAYLLLIVGCRMSIAQTGYNFKTFAREAKIIMVDIDEAEINKESVMADLGIVADVKEFCDVLNPLAKSLDCVDWVIRCKQWKSKYPVVLPEYKDQKEKVNSFHFIDVLSDKLPDDAVIVTDMGTSFTCTMQTFKVKKGQRLFTASGHAPMGYGLPGAIGACFANGKKRTICITGDGGLQFNIQELQTIVHHKLPITIFVLNNGGYLTMKHTQQNHFGKYVGAEKESGVSCPETKSIAYAYGLPFMRIDEHYMLESRVDSALGVEGPMVCEIMMDENQLLIPRLTSLKRPDGSILSKPLEDLYPFLPRDEFKAQMIVKPVEILE